MRIELLGNGTMVHASWPGGCGVFDVHNFEAFRNVSFEAKTAPCRCKNYGWVPPCQEPARDLDGIGSMCRLTAGHDGDHQPSIGRGVPDPVTLPHALVQTLYDLAINSLDFGSGFWGFEEHQAVHKLAEMIGATYPECGERVWPPDYVPGSWDYRSGEKPPHTIGCSKPKGHATGHSPWTPETVAP